MAVENDKTFESIYNRLRDDLSRIQDSYNAISEFNKEWQLVVPEADEMNQMLKDSLKEFDNQKGKIMRKETKCVFLGDTSAGKSTLINALLKRCDLPNDKGRTTNCFLEISLNERTFIMIEENIDFLKSLTYCGRINLNGSKVKVYIDKNDSFFLKESMVIIDIPGFDIDPQIDETIDKYCTEADIIVLVINATICTKGSIKTFLKKIQTRFTKLDLFLVFNYYDELENADNKSNNIAQLKEDAKQLFTINIKCTTNWESERMFFLSAKKQMEFNKQVNNEANQTWDEEFKKFHDRLLKAMSKDPFTRRFDYVESLQDVIRENKEKLKSLVDITKKKIKDYVDESKNILKKFDYSQSEMDEVLNLSCKELVKYLTIREISTAELKRTKESLPEEVQQQCSNESTNSLSKTLIFYIALVNEANIIENGNKYFKKYDDEFNNYSHISTIQQNIRNKIIEYLLKEIGKDFKNFKADIIESIEKECTNENKNTVLLLQKLYFRKYFNLENMSNTDLIKIINWGELFSHLNSDIFNEAPNECDGNKIKVIICEYSEGNSEKGESLSDKVETIIAKQLQESLNEEYYQFLKDIDNLLLKQFEEKLNRDSI